MSAGFSREQVVAVAALANLDLDSTELDLFARQLGDILAYADQLQGIDTTGVSPTTAVLTRHPSDRADQVAPSLTRDEVLANAPDGADAGLFRVPRVIG